MERTDREIIDFMRRYETEKNEIIFAMGELLAFMGIPDGPILALEATEAIEGEIQQVKFLKSRYQDYLRSRKATDYISFDRYLEKVAKGEITV